MSCQQPVGTSHIPSAAARPTDDAAALSQALAEAWAVVHLAEQRGHRDISDALHQAIASAADSATTPASAVDDLDDAREQALARLDACWALADEAAEVQ